MSCALLHMHFKLAQCNIMPGVPESMVVIGRSKIKGEQSPFVPVQEHTTAEFWRVVTSVPGGSALRSRPPVRAALSALVGSARAVP